MKSDTPNLVENLEPIKTLIPLNCLKARPVYYSQKPGNIKNLIKFIAIDNLKTERAVVVQPSKPISKCIDLIRKDESKTL